MTKEIELQFEEKLTARLGSGFSRPNLNNMRKFYLTYPNCQTISDNLNWSQIQYNFTEETLSAIEEARRISKDATVKTYSNAKELFKDCE